MNVNNLINEKSPYLLQHAYNPVYWYTWKDNALKKAKDEDRLIFLSIGYSTCHWCHVMEKESFEDDEVAYVLNDHFISIKVDREERPDIDSIYMKACQRLTGSGGWPLNVILTPDKKPIYAFTYLPKNRRAGFSGLIEVLTKISELWKEDKENIIKRANDFSSILENKVGNVVSVGKETIEKAISSYKGLYDESYGGFGHLPKFPSPHNLTFLLNNYYISDDKELLEIVEHTLKSMYRGGIFDHIGFGFSRYSVDEKWLVPHFEKMLYDNALLVIAYLEVYKITKNPLYKRVIESIFIYIDRDMTSEEGAFYSAEDADSEGEEGKFYLFERDEIYRILEKEAPIICELYNVTEAGNFEGKNILNLINSDINNSLSDNQRMKLFDFRENRKRPHKDKKILTSWNGLMISAFASAGRVFLEDIYTKIAEKAVEFVLCNLIEDDRLLARHIDGESSYLGYLDDYAFLVDSLIELYQSTFNIKYIKKAYEINKHMIDLFYDDELGAFFLTGNDSEELIYRPKEGYDGAMPSGNSIAIRNIIRLARIYQDESLIRYAEGTIDYFSSEIKSYETGYSAMLSSYQMILNSTKEVVITGDKKKMKEVLVYLRGKHMPFTSVILKDEESIEEFKFLENYKNKNEHFTIYICENYSCKEPITSLEELKSHFNE
ncbi:thioredoxin domain-containing protein [Mycoplasmatota bacterium zrk1]